MIRSAAKNYQDVAVVVSPADYRRHSGRAEMRSARRSVAARPNGAWRSKAFRTTADYDAAISARLAQVERRPVLCPPT